MPTLAIIGASGKLGFATLTSLLDHGLLKASDLVLTTSSPTGEQKLQDAASKGAEIRHVNWDDDQPAWESALKGCDAVFLISSSRIEKDFHDAPPGKGREADHFKCLEAAKAVGIKHVYYASLAFANPSKSNVMTAHERTEAWLAEEWKGGWTVMREGLYNESWPLYFGHYGLKDDDRTEVLVGGDSKISWTSIADLGLANALILAGDKGEWELRTVYLSQSAAYTLGEVAGMVSKAKAVREPQATETKATETNAPKDINLKVVSRTEHEDFYINTRHMDPAFIKWWSKTYDALRDGECAIKDPTLESLLREKGMKPQSMAGTVGEMIG
ncbi:hypothetical protein LTR56_001375 [Elasticomyces elasticus]|nr:hypothetical protein LTR56_001375 [Elasticomyces elasticus]KAK3667556.1 hypothetical protein LTR22_001734 [Elasticomyces elasticus]KAK4927963.1 hypothetical protein LTR49_005162 [Elasticomyces elasticus]KAK5762400.1 hypothetical protein LTS12_007377 [Elasticomyces elasticus]